MSSSLLLFNPSEIPYGNLSPLKDNIVSKSYASLIKLDLTRKIAESKKYNDARKESLDIFLNDQSVLTFDFLKNALNEKYKKNTSLSDIKGDIVYLPEKNNFIGKYLTQLRDKMYKQSEKNKEIYKKDFINKVYSIVETLKNEFVEGNNNLKNYINKNVEEILKQRYIETKPINIINITELLDMKNENFKDINYFLHFPDSIASVLRATHYKEYNENVDRKNKEEIISFYIDDLVNKNVKDKIDRYVSKKNLLYELEKNNQLDPLINRLVKLKELNQIKNFKYTFSPINENEIVKHEFIDLPDFIESDSKNKKDKKDIKKTEKINKPYDIMNFLESPVEISKTKSSTIPSDSNDMFYVNDESEHSPYFMEPININSIVYPSVMHYVRAKQFEFFGFNMFKAYEMVKDEDHEKLKTMYEDFLRNYINKKVTEKASELLNEKYKYTEKISKNNTLLLSTINEYKNIIFNDHEDFLLGIGDGNGQNFIGKYMEKIRSKLFEEYNYLVIQALPKPKIVSISSILKDENMLLFTKQKVKDLYLMMKLSKENFNYTDIESFYFIYKNFLDCITQINIPTFNKENVPHDFEKSMDIKVNKECLTEMWKYAFYIYAATKKVDNWKLLISMRDYKSLDFLNKKDVFKGDSFDSFKNLEIEKMPMEEIKIKRFNENIIKQSEKIDYSLFKITDESEYSSLLPKHIKQVSNIFKKWFKNESVLNIIDSTAHIGVDSVNFSIDFPKAKIHSYEINKNTFKLLKQNVSTFNNINVTNINFLNAELPENISFVYIDAPWGGRDYKSKKIDTLELFLGKENVKEVARRLLVNKTNVVVLKVPFNYHFSDLNKNFIVEREDVKDGNKISYTLLKLTLSPNMKVKYLIKPLVVKTFLNIFNTIDAFKNKNNLNMSYIKFAFQLVFLGKDDSINLKEGDENDPYYQDIIMTLLKDSDMEEIELFTKTLFLSKGLKYCVEKIINSIDYLNQKDVINRILLFSNSKKFKSDKIKKEQEEEKEEQENLFVNEDEKDINDDDESDKEQEGYDDDEDEDEKDEDEERDEDEHDDKEREEDRDNEVDFDMDIDFEEY